MADYPTVTPIVREGVVAGQSYGFGISGEAFAHVIPTVPPGWLVLVIKSDRDSTRAKANALIALDDQARRQLIELLGGTA
jgi:hypothetical protein